jgi:hypothetical protein
MNGLVGFVRTVYSGFFNVFSYDQLSSTCTYRSCHRLGSCTQPPCAVPLRDFSMTFHIGTLFHTRDTCGSCCYALQQHGPAGLCCVRMTRHSLRTNTVSSGIIINIEC